MKVKHSNLAKIGEKHMIFNGKFYLFMGEEHKIEVYNKNQWHSCTLYYNTLDDIKDILSSLGFSIHTDNVCTIKGDK